MSVPNRQSGPDVPQQLKIFTCAKARLDSSSAAGSCSNLRKKEDVVMRKTKKQPMKCLRRRLTEEDLARVAGGNGAPTFRFFFKRWGTGMTQVDPPSLTL